MFERAVHVIEGYAIAELVGINLLPFVVEFRKVHHYVTLRAVQRSSRTVFIEVAVVIAQVGNRHFAISGLFTQAASELSQKHGYHATVDITRDVGRVAYGLVENDGCIHYLLILKRERADGGIGRGGLCCRCDIAFPAVYGNTVGLACRNLNAHGGASTTPDGSVSRRVRYRDRSPGGVSIVICGHVHCYELTIVR